VIVVTMLSLKHTAPTCLFYINAPMHSLYRGLGDVNFNSAPRMEIIFCRTNGC